MKQFLKVQSIALWAVVAAIINLGIAFGWWQMSAQQIGVINTLFVAVLMVLRQMFSVTE